MQNKDLIKLLKKNPNKELLIKIKGIYMAIESIDLNDDYIIIEPREDFKKFIQDTDLEK